MFSEEIICGHLVESSDEMRAIYIEGEMISDVRSIELGNLVSNEVLSACTLYPGFIDIHVHGAAGIDVNSADADGLLEIARYLAKKGVTAWMPTLVPDSDENYQRAITAIDRVMEVQSSLPVTQVVGVHYEGVFANEKMCGALRPEFFKKFTGIEIDDLPRLRQGVHMMTLAPEIEGGIELIRELKKQGWIVAIGHTRAEAAILDTAFAAGASHFTHFFNAMTGVHHRDLGVAGWALANADVSFDVIADGIHIHPEMLKFACRSKGPEMVSLISDSIAPTGLGDGEFSLWGENISVEGGRTRNERGSIAGSVITLLDAVNLMRSLGFSGDEIAAMASRNPARLLGLGEMRGAIEPGKRADIVAIGEDGMPALVIIGGRVVKE